MPSATTWCWRPRPPPSTLGRFANSTAIPTLVTAQRHKGDYGFNVFHNSNPQHGGSYARHERRMREGEVEDFLRSVKGWQSVHDSFTDELDGEKGTRIDASSTEINAQQSSSHPSPENATCTPPAFLGDEAIKRTFVFATYREAYRFMGRLWAFAYGSDKYPHVLWDNCRITVYLYSPTFRGLSKREARMAAFLNDQYNMARKSTIQQGRILEKVSRGSAVEEFVGEEGQLALAQRGKVSRLREATERPRDWRALLQRTPESEPAPQQTKS